MKPSLMRRIFNWYPPYLGAGVHVEHIADDWSELVVSMPLRFYNRNYVGTHFGGSLYSMVDPHLMILVMQRLEGQYIVWDQRAEIRFKKPGKGRVRAQIQIPEKRFEEIRAACADGSAYRPEFLVEIRDKEGDVVAEVKKQLYVKKK